MWDDVFIDDYVDMSWYCYWWYKLRNSDSDSGGDNGDGGNNGMW